MTYVLAMPLDDGGTVLVEVSGTPSGVERVGRVGDVVRDTAETLQQALARIRPAAAAVLDSVRGMAPAPDKVKVEFGVTLTAEAGVVVARATSEANFKVTAEWSVRSDPARAEDVIRAGQAADGCIRCASSA